jgi:hypothetical protein
MPTHTLLSAERVLITLLAGILAFVLTVYLTGFLADWRLSDFERRLLPVVGHWFLPLYVFFFGSLFIVTPLGYACGYVCGKSPPYFAVPAALVLALPFFLVDPYEPCVYMHMLLLALTFVLACGAGARHRRLHRPRPLFNRSQARQASGAYILLLDIGLFLLGVLCVLCLHSALTHRSFARISTLLVIVVVGLPAPAYLRSRVRAMEVVSAA